jgi:3-oxoadipate enol-lactonase
MAQAKAHLAYESVGTGLPLVLLHAYPLQGEMWRGELERLGSRMHVIVPDLPGFGKSARQAKPSIPQMAQAVSELLDSLSVEIPVVMAGLSMGGYVAFEFYRQFPNRVMALGLFSTRASGDTPEIKRGRALSEKKIRREGLDRVTKMVLSNERNGVADSLMAMAQRRDSTGLLSSLLCPTLILAGDEDSFIPVEESQAMADLIPNAQFEVIEHAGHLINLENPEVFLIKLENFLQTHVLKTNKTL